METVEAIGGMQFFLDENFPRAARSALEPPGHTAAHALPHFPPRTADKPLFAEAQSAEQFLSPLTASPSTRFRGPLSHAGAIVITVRKANRAEVLRRLADALVLIGQRGLRDTVLLHRHATVRPAFTRRSSAVSTAQKM